MCEFCHKHGEGKKWYLQAKNYSNDLVMDRERGEYIDKFLVDFERRNRKTLQKLELFSKAPKAVRSVVGAYVTNHQKKHHFGQVVPIEDIERMLDIANCIVRVDCVCRRVTVNQRSGRYCFGISVDPDGGAIARATSHVAAPDALGLEKLDRGEALDMIRGFEHDGLMHSVWTFGTPFIGGICNCDNTSCLAMRVQMGHGIQVMFKGEHIARVDPDLCIGCKACLRLCRFDASSFSDHKAAIDPSKCYGCGVCRAECPTGAIELTARTASDW